MSQSAPTAALLIIGAEVLAGKVNDENAPFLLRALRQRGVEVVEIRTIGDDVTAIAGAVRALCHVADHVFTTGGVGPTHDDVTIAGIAAAFDRRVVRDPAIAARLVARYGEAVTEAHWKLAEVPEGARVVLDAPSLVPVVCLDKVRVLPGVPSLMRSCFAHVAAELGGTPFATAALLLNTSETRIAAHLSTVQQRHPEVAIGSYPRFDDAPYRVKVTVDGRDAELVRVVLAELRAGIEPASIVGEEPAVA